MERIHTLIHKLKNQLDNNETTQQMLYTAQLLLAELSNNQNATTIENKVSVVLPQTYTAIEIAEPATIDTVVTPIVVAEKVAEKKIDLVNEKVEVNTPPSISEIIAKVVDEPKLSKQESTHKIVHSLIIEDDGTAEQEIKEINDIVQDKQPSINDALKVDKKEIAHTHVDTPVKDLRKAIGINDKYLFINELFNGDETTYERSIKTINNFSVFPEAEQWIKRELHTKMCWIAESPTVKAFDNIVRRRFS